MFNPFLDSNTLNMVIDCKNSIQGNMILVLQSQWVLEILNIEIMTPRNGHVNEGDPEFTFNRFILHV